VDPLRRGALPDFATGYAVEAHFHRREIDHALNQVDWRSFRTAYWDAGAVPDALVALIFGDLPVAMEASDVLWSGLCHQHAYISSAGLPAYRFLHLALREAPDELIVEILDIVQGLATVGLEEFGIDTKAWSDLLLMQLRVDKATYETLAGDDDEQISSFAHDIVEAI